MGKGFNLLTPS